MFRPAFFKPSGGHFIEVIVFFFPLENILEDSPIKDKESTRCIDDTVTVQSDN